jgi:regulator of replication initiation timing
MSDLQALLDENARLRVENAELRALVNVLACESDLKGNDANEWWMGDWDYEVGLTTEQRIMLRQMFPDGRPHA